MEPPSQSNRQEYPHTTDAALVAHALAGDKDAFGLLAERHYALALGMARRMLGSIDITEEVVQEALLRAYLSLDNLREPARFSAWLCGIVLNLCRSYLRRRPTHPLSLEVLAGGVAFDALPFASVEPGPEEMAEFHEQHRLILAAVYELSPRNRDAVLLFYYDDLSVREIALLLGISVAAVKGRLHKSRREIKERLGGTIFLPGTAQQTSVPIDENQLQKERKSAMIPVTVLDVVINPVSEHRVIVLHDAHGQRILPIWVGPYEGDTIARYLLGNGTDRPLTYDFIASLLNASGDALEEVRIEALRGYTFYGIAKVRTGETVVEIDARPSDIIALALRTGSPILVAEDVMEASGAAIPPQTEMESLGQGLRQQKEQQTETAGRPAEESSISKEEEGTLAQRAFLEDFFSRSTD
ncbi:MAG: bifunctional nuclease domain-containing protein [Caldilineaceae bacterium]